MPDYSSAIARTRINDFIPVFLAKGTSHFVSRISYCILRLRYSWGLVISNLRDSYPPCTNSWRTHSLNLIKTTLHLVNLSILHTTYSMSKKILSRQLICLNQKLLNFMLPLLIYGLISTKEKSWEKLTAFLPAFFIKKRPLRRERRGQLGKKLIHQPLGLVQSLHIMWKPL